MPTTPRLFSQPDQPSDDRLTGDVLFFEVTRGRTAFPYRPVDRDPFVIGSGPDCDLRLGGNLPAVHTILRVSAETVRLEPVASQPPLLVNGAVPMPIPLEPGDRLTLGGVELTFWKMPLSQALPLLEDNRQPSELSAVELVARIEREEEMVADFEAGQARGAAALWLRVQQTAAELEEAPVSDETTDLLDELEEAVRQLSSFSDRLDERAQRLAECETSQAETAELLLHAQEELTAHLDRLHEELDDALPVVEDRQPPQFRKAA